MNNNIKNSNILEILIKIKAYPNSTQRELAEKLKFSIGKLNYCLNNLKKNGLIKVINNNKDLKKINPLYALTSKGNLTKTRLARNILKQKIETFP